MLLGKRERETERETRIKRKNSVVIETKMKQSTMLWVTLSMLNMLNIM